MAHTLTLREKVGRKPLKNFKYYMIYFQSYVTILKYLQCSFHLQLKAKFVHTFRYSTWMDYSK